MLATIADLEAALGRGVDAGELEKAQRALRLASNRATTLAPWADWDPDVPEAVVDAVSGLAARLFNARTDGLVAIGPFRYGERQPRDFTDDELDALGLSRSSHSISIARPDPE